jgi:hypothetical protein
MHGGVTPSVRRTRRLDAPGELHDTHLFLFEGPGLQPLYRVVADLVDPLLADLQRLGCRNACDALRLEFAAAAKAVEVVGSNEAKVTVNRFMGALKAGLDTFSPTLPPATAVTAIIAALGAVGTTIADLLSTINTLPDAFSGAITISNIFGADRDDKARQLIGELAAQGSLARLAYTIKLQMINWLLTSPGLFTIDVTTDDEENAINSVLQAAKDYDRPSSTSWLEGQPGSPSTRTSRGINSTSC